MSDHSGLTPHGPGFSFVDAVEVDVEAKRAVATKRLDPSLPFFADHFPGNPLMPGVLLAEAGAQACGCLWGRLRGKQTPETFVLARIDKFKLGRAVLPCETIRCEVVLVREFGALAEFEARIFVADQLAAGGVLTLAVPLQTSN